MSKKQKYISVLLVIFLTVLLYIPTAKGEEKVEGKTFFTLANIWYEHPDKIFSTNYHKGTVIPAGAKVTVKGLKDDEIRFVDEKGQAFTIIFMKKHSKGGTVIQDYFKQYFSEENPLGEGGPFQNFSADEQTNIKKGKIAVGMSKAAVLMAYGYPPGHKTPSLEGDEWIYWKDRFVNEPVYFKDNKVSQIGR